MCRTVWTFPSIVFKQPLLKVSRDASVMDRVARVADENVNVEKGVHWLACQAVVFGALREKVKMEARLHFVTAWQPSLFRCAPSEGWARQDSNLGPRDYESPALTAELQAHFHINTIVAGAGLRNVHRWHRRELPR